MIVWLNFFHYSKDSIYEIDVFPDKSSKLVWVWISTQKKVSFKFAFSFAFLSGCLWARRNSCEEATSWEKAGKENGKLHNEQFLMWLGDPQLYVLWLFLSSPSNAIFCENRYFVSISAGFTLKGSDFGMRIKFITINDHVMTWWTRSLKTR